MSLLDIRDLHAEFKTRHGWLPAVQGVNLRIERGETVALVGESGSGKSVTAQAVLGLLPRHSARVPRGQVLLNGQDLLALPEPAWRTVRGRRIAMVFQEPLTALNPVYTIGQQITEALRLHHPLTRAEAWSRAVALLERVHIPAATQRAHDHPHRLSGGMRQRAMIAMALACEPELLIADEPTTALDVSTQAQILALLQELQAERGMGLLLITHDLNVVAQVASRAAVMYAGRIQEEGPVGTLLDAPAHPYTRGLIAAQDTEGLPPGSPLPEITGTVPPLHRLPPGCSFAPRCPQASARCRQAVPATGPFGGGHHVACHHPLAAPPQLWREAA